eukprot:TRINITY_DN3515_c0_g2_i1.p1 TRINITY_DN3515_c0_g2~~TRINITY_DN3515_c0_g2_i1.p1  ORF type:complete len:1473 (-),score=252.58 TRINITY_DN3515_c0_g2_i1:1080-5219(-)
MIEFELRLQAHLLLIVDNYIPLMIKEKALNVSSSAISFLSSTSELMLRMSEDFLANLREIIPEDNDRKVCCIGKLLQEMVGIVRPVYSSFYANPSKWNSIVSIFEREEMRKAMDKTYRVVGRSFAECLKYPFRVLPSYNTSLTGLVANAVALSYQHPDLKDRELALHWVRNLLSAQQKSMDQIIKALQVLEVTSNISDITSSFFSNVQHRSLVHIESVKKQKKRIGKAKDRTLFLFSDCLIYCDSRITPSAPAKEKSGGSRDVADCQPLTRSASLSSATTASVASRVHHTASSCLRVKEDQVHHHCLGIIPANRIVVSECEKLDDTSFELERVDQHKRYVITTRSAAAKKKWIELLTGTQKGDMSEQRDTASAFDDPSGLSAESNAALYRLGKSLRYCTIYVYMCSREGGVVMKDRMYHLRKYTNTFLATEAIDWIALHVGVKRADAILVGMELQKRKMIRHAADEEVFADRFLFFKDDQRNCLNFVGGQVADQTLPCEVASWLLEQICAIYKRHEESLSTFGEKALGMLMLDVEYARFKKAVGALQDVDLSIIDSGAQMAFWLNTFNLLSLHAHIEMCKQVSSISSLSKYIAYYKRVWYLIGGYRFSLWDIEHCVLRACLSPPDDKTFNPKELQFAEYDERKEFRVLSPLPNLTFGLWRGCMSSPPVRCYSGDDLLKELKENTRVFFARHVRVFTHSNQRKVVLPRILQWYMKDFGETPRNTLLQLMKQFSSRQGKDLAFLMRDRSASVDISFSEFKTTFQHPFYDVDEAEDDGSGNTNIKSYTFPTKALAAHPTVYVQEILGESDMAFSVARLMAMELSKIRRNELFSLEVSLAKNQRLLYEASGSIDESEPNVLRSLVKTLLYANARRQEYMENSEQVIDVFKDYCGNYEGLTFRPSTYKKDPVLQWVAINLHVQKLVASNSKEMENPSTYIITTFGAPAAHLYKFKDGLRQMQEVRRKLFLDAMPCIHASSLASATNLHGLELSDAFIGTALSPTCPLDGSTGSAQSPEGKTGSQAAQEESAPVMAFLRLLDLSVSYDHRWDICVSQAICALATAFKSQLQLMLHDLYYWEQVISVGYLIHFESLLSTRGAENGMLGDMDVAVRFLQHCSIRLKQCDAGEEEDPLPSSDGSSSFASSSIFLDEIKIHRIHAPLSPSMDPEDLLRIELIFAAPREVMCFLPSFLQVEGPICVVPVLFTQGINEEQTVAIALGECKLQEDINMENLGILTEYFEKYRSYRQGLPEALGCSVADLGVELSKIGDIIKNSHNEKNVEVLPFTADFTRKLKGSRLTSCKSAKDRTSMSVTWEQARLLHYHHEVDADEVSRITNEMRLNGVRRENAFKNIGKKYFAFNKIQRSLIPEVYRAPAGSAGAGVS